jgi:hypothetical protein
LYIRGVKWTTKYIGGYIDFFLWEGEYQLIAYWQRSTMRWKKQLSERREIEQLCLPKVLFFVCVKWTYHHNSLNYRPVWSMARILPK